jgi:hypothetical protein
MDEQLQRGQGGTGQDRQGSGGTHTQSSALVLYSHCFAVYYYWYYTSHQSFHYVTKCFRSDLSISSKK